MLSFAKLATSMGLSKTVAEAVGARRARDVCTLTLKPRANLVYVLVTILGLMRSLPFWHMLGLL